MRRFRAFLPIMEITFIVRMITKVFYNLLCMSHFSKKKLITFELNLTITYHTFTE